MKTHKTFSQASKCHWGRNVEGELIPTNEELIVGCLQRIAKSLEDIDLYMYSKRTESEKLKKQNTSLRNQIKTLKNKPK